MANYFPPRDGEGNRGSDALTAYLLLASAEAASQDPRFDLPADARALMVQGLTAFVEGRINRSGWSPQKDLDVRKLAALDALARSGQAKGRMLTSITVAPNQWPTHAVLHWANVLQRVTDAPQRTERLAEAMQILRARLAYNGTRTGFSTDASDGWWWLMASADTNAAQLLLTVMDDAAWRGDIGRLATGLLARQQRGAWGTTTANLWGSLALRKFSARFESTPVTGTTRASTAAARGSVDWAKAASPSPLALTLPWGKDTSGDQLSVTQQGTGKPWLTLQSLAAVPLTRPFSAGYQIQKTVTPTQQAVKGQFNRGDIVRVTLEINATADMTWVVVSDPIPGGATILGGGLGRDSEIATQGEKQSGNASPVFEERSFEALRSYFDYLPKGKVKVEYTVRLNNVGDFSLPPTRVEAMYAPEVYGELPNARVKVGAAK